jgi:hypothetical protein
VRGLRRVDSVRSCRTPGISERRVASSSSACWRDGGL